MARRKPAADGSCAPGAVCRAGHVLATAPSPPRGMTGRSPGGCRRKGGPSRPARQAPGAFRCPDASNSDGAASRPRAPMTGT